MFEHKCILITLILILSNLTIVKPIPLNDFSPEKGKPWYDAVIRRFYGPWYIVRKKNGDYIDYNDYGARIEDSEEPGSFEMPYNRSPTRYGYLNDFPSIHDTGLSEFNPGYGLSSIGLAAFNTGIRTGDWPDGNASDSKETDASAAAENTTDNSESQENL